MNDQWALAQTCKTMLRLFEERYALMFGNNIHHPNTFTLGHMHGTWQHFTINNTTPTTPYNIAFTLTVTLTLACNATKPHIHVCIQEFFEDVRAFIYVYNIYEPIPDLIHMLKYMLRKTHRSYYFHKAVHYHTHAHRDQYEINKVFWPRCTWKRDHCNLVGISLCSINCPFGGDDMEGRIRLGLVDPRWRTWEQYKYGVYDEHAAFWHAECHFSRRYSLSNNCTHPFEHMRVDIQIKKYMCQYHVRIHKTDPDPDSDPDPCVPISFKDDEFKKRIRFFAQCVYSIFFEVGYTECLRSAHGYNGWLREVSPNFCIDIPNTLDDLWDTLTHGEIIIVYDT